MEITTIECFGTTTTIEYETINIQTPEAHALRKWPDWRREAFETALSAVSALALELPLSGDAQKDEPAEAEA